MDAVKAFNAELSSLYEVKPPISKAKMAAMTRSAIKAIKFYKHVVQSVEKFILKCKPEYKIPGLYVIDSIVRQSRHQFGTDKDVFAPRFAKNMQQTFLNLYKCLPEDKSRIIRVLNLWQKNQVFPAEVIDPLFDMANPNNPIHKELEAAVPSNGLATAPGPSSGASTITKGSPALQKTATMVKGSQQPGVNDVSLGGSSLSLNDVNVLAHIQELQRLLTPSAIKGDSGQNVHFDKRLLDFDYDDEDEEVNPSPRTQPTETVANLLTNPEVLRQLQTLQQSMVGPPQTELDLEKMRRLQEMKQQEEEFDKHLAQTVPNLPFASECEFKPSVQTINMPNYFMTANMAGAMQDMSLPPPNYKTQPDFNMNPVISTNNGDFVMGNVGMNDSGDVEVINLDHDDSVSNSPSEERYGSRRRRSRSRDRSRDRGRDRDRRRRSRSRSSRSGRRHRTRSRDRDNRKGRDKEKKEETEKDKERKKRGLPAIKRDNLSVCSTTLWVGHLSKLVHQDDLSNTFGEFGDVVSIDLIPPRGCAFIVMHRRQDAARCLSKLKNHVLHGKAITLAWAPGKGVKGKDLKDYWEGDLGVSYIPWNKIKEDIDLELLEDGGMIDEDTMPAWMKIKMAALSSSNVVKQAELPFVAAIPPPLDTSQPPPAPTGMLPPSMLPPMVTPFQFNNRLLGMPGMMPPNIPMGVPPPNMMPNQMLAPFSQPPAMMPAPMPPPLQPDQPTNPANDQNFKALSDTLMTMAQHFGMMPQPPQMGLTPLPDDSMDVEMEDAEKPEPLMPLSEQLKASITPSSRDHSHEPPRQRNRSRSRDPTNHERRPDRRWAEQSCDPDERRERENNLNERLKEMAGMSYVGVEMSPPHDEFYPIMDNCPPELLDGPPMDIMMGGASPPDRFMRNRRDFRGDFRGPSNFFRDEYHDDFRPMRGGPPMMRGGPRGPIRGGPPMRGFFPRGPMRPPLRPPGSSWNDRPNFNPRFDRPDFYPPPRAMFDDVPPPHQSGRGPRFDRGGSANREFEFEGGSRERRSRWEEDKDSSFEGPPGEEPPSGRKGNQTPLRDEGPPGMEAEPRNGVEDKGEEISEGGVVEEQAPPEEAAPAAAAAASPPLLNNCEQKESTEEVACEEK